MNLSSDVKMDGIEKFFSAPVPSDLDDDERNLWILMRFHFKKNGR